MKHVFLVWHTHKLLPKEDDAKLIGVYESRVAAKHAIERASRLPGFSASTRGFEISEYEVGIDHWTEGFITVSHHQK